MGAPPAPDLRAPFSLRFAGIAGAPLDQRIHRLLHPDLGELSIFLLPIGPDRYQAIFS